jgi:hypothetical protein
MPVSGMAYLDRPQEAGYFLFPDLSVRHEGRYKLTFNLYEETKEDKDKDKDEPDTPATSVDSITGGSFDYRMEVKSQEFIVYSAKKFPGLASSTALSRVISEQGCRVRIRRDIRMRRRGRKGDDGGDYEEGDEYSRSRRTATPDNRNDYNRQRSMSNSSERAPYPGDPQRRPSMSDYHHQPQYQQNSQPGKHHLQFMGSNANPPYPAAPPQPYQQPPSVPASPVYPPSQHGASYPPQSYAPPPPPPAPRSHSRERTPSQGPAYAPINPAPPRREAQQQESRPAPMQLPPIQPSPHHPPTPQQSHQPLPPQQYKPRQSLPPLQIDSNMSAPSRPPLPSQSPVVPDRRTLVPLGMLMNNPPPSSKSGPTDPKTLPPPTQYAGTKRSRDETFRPETEIRSRYQDGARDQGVVEDVYQEEENMQFARANGTVSWTKYLPY